MDKLKLSAIIGVSILAVIAVCVFGVQSAQNKAIRLEEAIGQADSDIKVQEKRRGGFGLQLGRYGKTIR